MTLVTNSPLTGSPAATATTPPAVPVAPRRAGRARVFRALAVTSTKEILRDPKTLFFTVVFPFLFLGLFFFMDSTFMSEGPAPTAVVVQGEHAGQLAQSLHGGGLPATTDPAAATSAGAEAPVVWVQAHPDGVTATLTGKELPARAGVLDGLRDAGYPRRDVTFTGPDGTPVSDMLATSVPSVLMVALLSLAFLGTAAPLVGLRQRGTLRLLGTMPVSRSTFLVAQWPVRGAVALVQVGIVVATAWAMGLLDPVRLPLLLITTGIGLLALLSIGYLIVARIRSQDLATTVMSLILPIALLLAGAMMPEELLPEAVVSVAHWVPTTVLSKAIGESLTGVHSGVLPLPLAWLFLAGVTVVCGLLASRLFTWDQGEGR